MKPLLIALWVFVAVVNCASINARSRRDVSEIVSTAYLSPDAETEAGPVEEHTTVEEVTEAAPAEPIVVEESAALGENGYEYRTIRRLVYRHRNRRDVSHLNLGYLPPLSVNAYLPPLEKSKPAPKVSQEYLPPVEKPTPAPIKPTNEYLPPVEPTTTQAPPPPNNEYLPPAPEQQVAEEVPAPELVPETEAPEIYTETEPEPEDVPEETAVLEADGYHYKKPDVVPDLGPIAPITGEYLPPLEDGVVVAEGPEEDTAVLADDGYHYRAIKRIRF